MKSHSMTLNTRAYSSTTADVNLVQIKLALLSELSNSLFTVLCFFTFTGLWAGKSHLQSLV